MNSNELVNILLSLDFVKDRDRNRYIFSDTDNIITFDFIKTDILITRFKNVTQFLYRMKYDNDDVSALCFFNSNNKYLINSEIDIVNFFASNNVFKFKANNRNIKWKNLN